MIEVKNVTKKYGKVVAVDNISFTINDGEIVGLLGPNGAGKSTTMNMMTGFIEQTSGDIIIDGYDMLKRPKKAKREIGYMPEERGLYPKKTVSEQLIYLGMLRGLSAKKAKENMKKWLAKMEVSEYENRKLETLSKGNQQKVQLAQTLITDPKIIILDEPFSGLDPVNSQILKDVISEQIQQGKLVIFSSHQMSYVEEFCQQIAILNHGDVVLSGELKEIKREFGRDRLVVSSLEETPEELAHRLRDTFADLLEVEKVQKDRLIIRKKASDAKLKILERLVEQDGDLEFFGMYEPSLNDIFVEKAGDEA